MEDPRKGNVYFVKQSLSAAFVQLPERHHVKSMSCPTLSFQAWSNDSHPPLWSGVSWSLSFNNGMPRGDYQSETRNRSGIGEEVLLLALDGTVNRGIDYQGGIHRTFSERH